MVSTASHTSQLSFRDSLQWQCCVPLGVTPVLHMGTTGCHHLTDRASNSHFKHHLNKNLTSQGKAPPPLHGGTQPGSAGGMELSAGASGSSKKLFWVSRLEKPQITPPSPAPECITSLSPELLTQLAQQHMVGLEPISGCSPRGAALQGGVGARLLLGGTRSPVVAQLRDAQQGTAPFSIAGDAPFRKPL